MIEEIRLRNYLDCWQYFALGDESAFWSLTPAQFRKIIEPYLNNWRPMTRNRISDLEAKMRDLEKQDERK